MAGWLQLAGARGVGMLPCGDQFQYLYATLDEIGHWLGCSARQDDGTWRRLG